MIGVSVIHGDLFVCLAMAEVSHGTGEREPTGESEGGELAPTTVIVDLRRMQLVVVIIETG